MTKNTEKRNIKNVIKVATQHPYHEDKNLQKSNNNIDERFLVFADSVPCVPKISHKCAQNNHFC